MERKKTSIDEGEREREGWGLSEWVRRKEEGEKCALSDVKWKTTPSEKNWLKT